MAETPKNTRMSQVRWSAPIKVRAYYGGVGTDTESLKEQLELEHIRWLQQVHGTQVFRDTGACSMDDKPEADATITSLEGVGCAIVTADCLPILLCSSDGEQVAAVHAGWKGLAANIVREAAAAFAAEPQGLHAWVGPAICQSCFEVGPEVKAVFEQTFDLQKPTAGNDRLQSFFKQGSEDRLQANLSGLAEAQLRDLGVQNITQSGLCTFCEKDRFYSWRRDQSSRRNISIIAIAPREK